jgi:chromosome segregation ATPase
MSEDLTKKLPTTDSDKLASILTTVQALEGRMERLEQKVEERLYDTRPIWEKAIADLAQMRESQEFLRKELHESQESLRKEVREIKTSQRDALRRMSVFHDTLISMQADYRDIYDRVRGFETKLNHTNSST